MRSNELPGGGLSRLGLPGGGTLDNAIPAVYVDACGADPTGNADSTAAG